MDVFKKVKIAILSKPLIMVPLSVCIPTYNGSNYLKECLDSILAQTFSNFEIVIVDDHSIDDSFEIAQRYAAGDGRIRVFRNKRNLGLVNNWNHCIGLAKGEWIKFVFQDDFIELNCLERLMEATNSSKKMIVCRRKIIFDGVSDKIKRMFESFRDRMSIDRVFGGRTDISPNDFCHAIMNNLRKNFIAEPTVVMLHRNVFDRYGMFNPDFIQLCDLEFWARVGCNCGMKYIPETLATFRVHSGMASSNNRDKQIFRMKVLDVLLLYHEFAYNPNFKYLRDHAVCGRINYNFEVLAAFEGIRTYFIAKAISIKKSKLNVSPAAEWKSFLFKYPKINQSPYYKRFKILGPFFLYRRLLMLIYRHIFTRFS